MKALQTLAKHIGKTINQMKMTPAERADAFYNTTEEIDTTLRATEDILGKDLSTLFADFHTSIFHIKYGNDETCKPINYVQIANTIEVMIQGLRERRSKLVKDFEALDENCHAFDMASIKKDIITPSDIREVEKFSKQVNQLFSEASRLQLDCIRELKRIQLTYTGIQLTQDYLHQDFTVPAHIANSPQDPFSKK